MRRVDGRVPAALQTRFDARSLTDKAVAFNAEVKNRIII
jgi:hypothetical protein